jgi:hypothetical protein
MSHGRLEFAAENDKGRWRVKMTWPKTDRTRYFGRFATEQEAQDWIEQHRWMDVAGSSNIPLPGHSFARPAITEVSLGRKIEPRHNSLVRD